jgi:CheY-like chemotaxis protein
MRVIIVDDEPDMLTVLRALLEDEGYEVMAAPDGKRGLELMRTTPDRCVVLVDMAMPEMDGAAVLQAVADDRHLATHHAYALMTAGLKMAAKRWMRFWRDSTRRSSSSRMIWICSMRRWTSSKRAS